MSFYCPAPETTIARNRSLGVSPQMASCGALLLLACSTGTSDPGLTSGAPSTTTSSEALVSSSTTASSAISSTTLQTSSSVGISTVSSGGETTTIGEGPSSNPSEETDSVEQTSSSASSEATSSQDPVSSSDVSTPASPKQSWVFTASTNGQLHAFELDTESGAATERDDQAIGSSGGDVFIAMAPGSTRLFAVYNRGIVAFDFDPATAAFTERARGTTLGGGTYVGISPDEQHAYVAHYGENQLSYLTFDGSAFSTAQGFAAGQRVHSAQESAAGGWVLVPCLGSNYVAQYRRDGDELQPASAPTVAVAGGPRHFAFNPNQSIVYVLSELSSELRTFEFTGAGGLGAVLDTDQIGVEQGGKYWGSDVKVSPDGRDLFAVDRNAQLVYHFDVQDDGTLEASGVTGDLGGVVRAFDPTPDGKLLVMGNENGVLVTFRFDSATNALEPVPNPPGGLGTIHTTLVREF